jgi:hypothetical protein
MRNERTWAIIIAIMTIIVAVGLIVPNRITTLVLGLMGIAW